MSLRDADEARRYTERWMAYLQGDLPAEAVEDFEEECLDDPQACEELYRELNLDAALSTVRGESPGMRPPHGASLRRRLLTFALVGSFGLGGVGVAWWAGSGGAPSLPQQESRCRPLQPKGAQDDFPDRFLWTRESGATAYRFELRRSDGSEVYWGTTVADTVLFLPADRQPPAPLGSWTWRVIPLRGTGSSAPASEAARFRIDG